MRKVIHKEVTTGGSFDFFLDSGSFYVFFFTISISLSGNKSLACGIYKAKEMMSPGDADWKLCIRILVENMYDFIMFHFYFV